MESKDKTFYPLIILFFILGLIIGYVIHKPEQVEKIEYINNTIEKIVVVTPTSASATPTAGPTTTTLPDFVVRNYDPSKDTASKTIELINWRAMPDAVSIHPGDTVLIKITDYTLQSPLTLILGTSYEENIGTSGARIITFNKEGVYRFKALKPSSDPTINPTPYAEGTINVA